jgi:hypothetical protein
MSYGTECVTLGSEIVSVNIFFKKYNVPPQIFKKIISYTTFFSHFFFLTKKLFFKTSIQYMYRLIV